MLPCMSDTPDRNLALELVRVTEAAALAAARWVGRGNGPGEEVDAGLAWLGGGFPLLLFLFSSFYLNIALAFRFKTKHAS